MFGMEHMEWHQTPENHVLDTIPCYVWIVCIPFPSRMVYHIASYAGLNESVATRQIVSAMLKKYI
jgi:hypothetical protein